MRSEAVLTSKNTKSQRLSGKQNIEFTFLHRPEVKDDKPEDSCAKSPIFCVDPCFFSLFQKGAPGTMSRLAGGWCSICRSFVRCDNITSGPRPTIKQLLPFDSSGMVWLFNEEVSI